MAFTVELPGALEPFADGRATLHFDERCATVGAALGLVGTAYPGVRDRVMDERGDLRVHVNVFVDGENSRFLSGLATPVHERSTIVILPAVSGG